ncbi:hypothetical protein EVAR_43861_1 [Eumeta japonica]|uniref:Uncharacterized protein n=1 Tax=Eumeta variegata TaxID=151549 RepID=A0A4C1X1A3_EUMVA|nr:hypothetical protein EVAR_43861_1 [Eumeta japonica]
MGRKDEGREPEMGIEIRLLFKPHQNWVVLQSSPFCWSSSRPRRICRRSWRPECNTPGNCCARGRPIIVEWERDARHSAGLSLVRRDLEHHLSAPLRGVQCYHFLTVDRIRRNVRHTDYNARNSAVAELVTKASQGRKIDTRGRRRKGRGALCPRISSFKGNPERQSFTRCTEYHTFRFYIQFGNEIFVKNRRECPCPGCGDTHGRLQLIPQERPPHLHALHRAAAVRHLVQRRCARVDFIETLK